MEKNKKASYVIDPKRLKGQGPALFNVTYEGTQYAGASGLHAGTSPVKVYDSMIRQILAENKRDYDSLEDVRVNFPFEDYHFDLIGRLAD